MASDPLMAEVNESIDQLTSEVTKLGMSLEKQLGDDSSRSTELSGSWSGATGVSAGDSVSFGELDGQPSYLEYDEEVEPSHASEPVLEEVISLLNENEDYGDLSVEQQCLADCDPNSVNAEIWRFIVDMPLPRRLDETEDDWSNDHDEGYEFAVLVKDDLPLLEKVYGDYEHILKKKGLLSQKRGASALPIDSILGREDSLMPQSTTPTESLPTEADELQVALHAFRSQRGSAHNSTEDFATSYVPVHKNPFALHANDMAAGSFASRRQSAGERRRSEVMGQHRFQGTDDNHCFFNMKVIFEPYRTGFEENKDFQYQKGTTIAGRYEVYDELGEAAFSTALQCVDLIAEEHEDQWVCLKVIKNNKDFLDQSLDEIKLLQFINSRGDPDEYHVLRLIDFFYYKEHLFIVSELLKENLYEFGKFISDNNFEVYYTLPRLKRISKQLLTALNFIHGLKLIHSDVKPENIVIKSFSRCEVKLIDFGSSCFTSDMLSTYIQSRSYRAPEVILGNKYDQRIDIWSVGAVLAELYTNYVLFENTCVPGMLARIVSVLGPFPEHVLEKGKEVHKYFTPSNILYMPKEPAEDNAIALLLPTRTNLRSRLHIAPKVPDSPLTDEDLFVDFIRELLNLDQEARVTAQEALNHPWLRDADTVEFSEYIIGQPAGGPPPDEDYDEEGELDNEDYEYSSHPLGGEGMEPIDIDAEVEMYETASLE